MSFVHAQIVIQVSDRKLTYITPTAPGAPEPSDANKSILFNDKAIFGFTGLAKLEGQPTDLWLAGILAGAGDDVIRAMNLVREALTRAYPRRHSHVPHTVMATGFRDDDGSLQPFNVLISNDFDGQRWHNKGTSTEFTGSWQACEPRQIIVGQAPGWISPSRLTRLARIIGRGLDRGLSIQTVVQLLSREIRDVAAGHVEVGADLMVSSLPVPVSVPVAGRTLSVVNDSVSSGMPAFYYLPAVGGPVSFGPTIVMRGAIFSNMEIRQP